MHEAMPYMIFLAFSFKYGVIRSLLVHIFIEFNQRMWTKLYHFYVATKDPAACPALFLYSKTDDLVTYDWVESCAASREKALGNVYQKCWEDSPHVSHIYKHETEYIQEMKNFARNIGADE